MLPFDQIAPTIPLLNILRKGEETIAGTMAVYTVIAVITVKRHTVLFPLLFGIVLGESLVAEFSSIAKRNAIILLQNLAKVVNNLSAL